jgi:predicted amidophosphoribosyltransferase
MGLGFMMPSMFAQTMQPGATAKSESVPLHQCPDCKLDIPTDAKFCPQCGHQQVVFRQCQNCGKNLTANAKFCSKCGKPSDVKPAPSICSRCNAENLPGAKFCNQCGEQISAGE